MADASVISGLGTAVGGLGGLLSGLFGGGSKKAKAPKIPGMSPQEDMLWNLLWPMISQSNSPQAQDIVKSLQDQFLSSTGFNPVEAFNPLTLQNPLPGLQGPGAPEQAASQRMLQLLTGQGPAIPDAIRNLVSQEFGSARNTGLMDIQDLFNRTNQGLNLQANRGFEDIARSQGLGLSSADLATRRGLEALKLSEERGFGGLSEMEKRIKDQLEESKRLGTGSVMQGYQDALLQAQNASQRNAAARGLRLTDTPITGALGEVMNTLEGQKNLGLAQVNDPYTRQLADLATKLGTQRTQLAQDVAQGRNYLSEDVTKQIADLMTGGTLAQERLAQDLGLSQERLGQSTMDQIQRLIQGSMGAEANALINRGMQQDQQTADLLKFFGGQRLGESQLLSQEELARRNLGANFYNAQANRNIGVMGQGQNTLLNLIQLLLGGAAGLQRGRYGGAQARPSTGMDFTKTGGGLANLLLGLGGTGLFGVGRPAPSMAQDFGGSLGTFG